MPASESASGATNLHKSIEQLIAETVRQSQSNHEAEKLRLSEALKNALVDIEASQASLTKAAGTLREALGEQPATIAEVETVTEEVAETSPEAAPQLEVVQPAVATPEVGPTSAPADDRGPHEMDVIAHNVTIANATGLQSWLRGRDEVANAQIREFVAGELRLHLDLTSGLEMTAFKQWLGEHAGDIVTSTDKVLEIRFTDAA